MRTVVRSVLVLGALGSPVAGAEDATEEGRPAVFVGGGLGLNDLADVPGPLFEAHAGGGWRGPRWMTAGLLSYAYTEDEPILGSWSIVRHDVELVGVLAFRPMPRRAFHVHGQLGIGAAFDRLSGVDPGASTRALSASVGAGAGWGPVALTFRYATPDAKVCSTDSRCFHASAAGQVLLSLTFDLCDRGRCQL
jgi:hypothetical protein